jgi:hypothetical protein
VKQTARILAALKRGPVTPLSFQGPTVDGLAPILRVAARIADLKADGYDIQTVRAPSGIAIYQLKLAPTNGGDRVMTASERQTGATPTSPISAVPLSPALFACEDPLSGIRGEAA